VRHRPRGRRRLGARSWDVHARVERFTEPALLLLLAERPAHGYELLELLPALTGSERVEMGNLYRLLRALEEEGLVSSEWDASAPGPAKRRYAITPEGTGLLDNWVDALRAAGGRIEAFVNRYERREEVNDAPSPSRS
jgi:PadR family transcriptional regulator, regulatory protein PadR